MEDGELKDAFVEVIGSYMKMAYKTWNREHYVSDEIIIEDLASLSEGEFQLNKEDVKLDTLARANDRRRSSSSRGKDDKKSRGKGGGRGRGNNRGRSNNRGRGRGRKK